MLRTLMVLVGLVFANLALAVPAMMNYQGQLFLNGSPAAGPVSVTFRLYDAQTGGTLLWTETDNVTATNGLFSTTFGDGTTLPYLPFSGQTLWLETEVSGTTLSPRTPFVSTPYAYRSQRADTAQVALTALSGGSGGPWSSTGSKVFVIDKEVGIGTTNPDQTLTVNGMFSLLPMIWSQPSVRGMFLYHAGAGGGNIFAYDYVNGQGDDIGLSGKTVSLATYNSSGAFDGPKLTVKSNGFVGIGTTDPTAKLQVQGMGWFTGDNTPLPPSAGTGVAIASVLGAGHIFSFDYSVPGPRNLLINYPGGNVGIGTANPTSKFHVEGDIRATGNIYGNFQGTINNALLWDGHSWGEAYPLASNANQVGGISASQFLRNDQTGSLNGNLIVNGTGGASNAVVINTTASSAGLLVVQNGNAAGIRARSNSATSVNGAVVGTALADGGSGVYGETGSLGVPGGSQDPNGASVGVFGNAHATGQSVGGAALGVYGRVASYQPPAGGAGIPAGVFGKADSDNGRNAGVIGETDSRTEGFGVRSYGNLGVSGDIYYTGSLIRTTLTPNGPVSLQQMNTAGDWCEDVGEGEMVDGRGHVELDPMFLKTVTIDEKHPMKIFVQPLAPCSGVYVQKGLTGFDVIELAGGKSSVSFDYRVVAVRKGGEDSRFRTTPAAESVLENQASESFK